MTRQPGPSINVFLSYAQQDKGLKQELVKHLAASQQSGQITWCGEREIQSEPETDWTQVIDPRLSEADLIVLLLSADLVGSGYCSGAEVRQALEKRSNGNAFLIVVLLRYVDLAELPLSTLPLLPRNAKPVVTWKDRDEAWWIIARDIRQAAMNLPRR